MRFLILAALVAGCAQAEVWNRAGSTPEEGRQAIARCEFEAARASAVHVARVDRYLAEQHVFGACMRAEGYTRVR